LLSTAFEDTVRCYVTGPHLAAMPVQACDPSVDEQPIVQGRARSEELELRLRTSQLLLLVR
jgi:hypothetical protein